MQMLIEILAHNSKLNSHVGKNTQPDDIFREVKKKRNFAFSMYSYISIYLSI